MPRLDAYKPRRIVLMNVRYKHAVVTKLALLVSLLAVAAWFVFFSQLSFGFPVEHVGDFLPLGTGYTLSVPVLAELNGIDSPAQLACPGEARESTTPVVDVASGHSDSRGAQNLQQERGDVLCRGHQTWFTPTSSAAPTFNPKSAACPRRVAVLTLSGEENEHILNIRENLTLQSALSPIDV